MAKKTIILIFSKVLTYLATIICNKLLVLAFGMGDVGTYQQILTIVNLSTLILMGIPDAIIYFFTDTDEHSMRIRKTIYVLIIIATVLSFLLSFFGIKLFVSYFDNFELSRYRLQIALLFSTSVLSTCFPSICVAYDRIKPLAILTFVNAILKTVVLGFTYISSFKFERMLNLLTLLTIIFLVGQVVVVIILEKNNNSNLCFKHDFREVMIYSLPLFVTTIVGQLTVLTDKLMIGGFFSTEVYASYAVAARELPYTLITSSLITITSPVLIHGMKNKNYKDSIKIWNQSVKYSAIFLVFAIVSNIVMADDLIIFLYSEEYLVSKDVFIIYLLALLPRVAYWGIFAKSLGKTKIVLVISSSEFILNIILNLIFIPIFGVKGAALGTVVSTYLCVSTWIILNKRFTGYKISEMIPIFEILKSIVINVVIGACVWGVLHSNIITINSHFLRLALVATVWGAIIAVIYRRDIKNILLLKGGNNN